MLLANICIQNDWLKKVRHIRVNSQIEALNYCYIDSAVGVDTGRKKLMTNGDSR